MPSTAKHTDQPLWDRIKAEITAGDRGGRPGQWSARKAQLASQAYKAQGGTYAGPKAADNHLQQWTEENWGTRSGARSQDSGERYLPEKSRAHLSEAEYRRSSDKKRADTAAGRQFSRQPADVAAKARGETKAALLREARAKNLPGRSRMDKAALRHALGR